MFGPAGHAYVYVSHGIHHCLNLTTGDGTAVLVRAVEPLDGMEEMIRRRGLDDPRLLCAGPGRLCQALGITRELDGARLDRPPFALYPAAEEVDVVRGVRVGITRAVGQPWRYGLAGSRFLSRALRPAQEGLAKHS